MKEKTKNRMDGLKMDKPLYTQWENDVMNSEVVNSLLLAKELNINSIHINMNGRIKNIHSKHFYKEYNVISFEDYISQGLELQ